ncbi:MAG TPA: matrixin family metalloprotease, partial [Chloroflexota bacterium]|nr:matrixin family metalloprotease [Chloroflexota bacterium]
MTLGAAWFAASSLSFGYYHWTFFANRTGPFVPVRAKFDLNALPNSTVLYFISDQPPAKLMPGDSVQSVMNEIRSAAAAWNQVPASAIRIAFGGIETAGATPQTTPGIDVVFDDNMPAGLLAQTRITLPDDLSAVANGANSVPILRSRVQFRSDLTLDKQASFSDLFYMTMVHEFGHSLGLQHTLTSGTMSTQLTAATTKAAPLSADDIAGLSILYPTPAFQASTGSITGTVTAGGSGVNLASVVALSTSGVAVSALTNPDGTYRIAGIPPGNYYVYAHPLPPAANGEAYPDNIYPPEDAQKNPFPANTGFITQFYPGTRDWTQAQQVSVKAGASTDGIGLDMQPRDTPGIPYLLTYGYQGQLHLASPPVVGGSASTVVFYAPGTTANGALIPGLNISAIGGPAQVRPGSLTFYSDPYGYFYVDTQPVTVATPVALAVTLPNDLYVLPAALTVVPGPGPRISAVTPAGTNDAQGNPIVNIAGSNLGTSTRVVFDGAAGTVVAANPDGSLSVAAPPAPANYTAYVEALSSDGQTSSQPVDAPPPPTFTYPAPLSGAAGSAVTIKPTVLSPGTDAGIEIDGLGSGFVDGKVTVGFGSSDIVVQQIWVPVPGKIMMNVRVSASAAPGPVTVTATSGLQTITAPAGVQVQAASPNQMSLRAPVLNYDTRLPSVPTGGGAFVGTSGLPLVIGSGWTLTVGGIATPVTLGAGVLYFAIPA